MIISFANRLAESLYCGLSDKETRSFPQLLHRIAFKKLDALHGAETLEMLRVPPGNRLKKLSGNRDHQYSLRINDQWRITFTFINGHAYDVAVEDYHT